MSVAFGATYGAGLLPRVRGRHAVGAARRHRAAAPPGRSRRPGAAPTPEQPADYSEGLDAAVACHDYPQLFDMAAPPAVRRAQLVASVRRENSRHPAVYGPFTVAEYLASDWEEQDWCTQWPVAAEEQPGGTAPTAQRPLRRDMPTLVLSGELDSITTPAEGAMRGPPVPERAPGRGRQQLPCHGRGRHRRMCGDGAAGIRPAPSKPPWGTRRPRVHSARFRRCARWAPSRRPWHKWSPARNLGGSHADLLEREAAAASSRHRRRP